MADTGGAAGSWAARLKASLAGGLAAPAPATAPPPPAPPEPLDEPVVTEEIASAQAEENAAPVEESPAPVEEVQAPSGEVQASPEPALGAEVAPALAAAPEAEAVPTAPPEPEAEAAPTPPAEPRPEEAELPEFSLLAVLTPQAAVEPRNRPDPLPSPLLEALTREPPAPAQAPKEARAGFSPSPLLDLLRMPEDAAAPLPPAIEALRAALPRPAPPAAALPPSPLLEALRTIPAEPVTEPPPLPEPPHSLPRAEPAPEPVALSEPLAAAPGPAVPQPASAATPPRQALPEREVRAVFELLVGRAPEEAELLPLRRFTRRLALRNAIMAGSAFREAVLSPAIAAALPLQGSGMVATNLDALDALGAGAAGEPDMVVDWFGLRTPIAIAPELAAHAGAVLPRPAPADPRAPAAEWIGLAASVAGATGSWRALSVDAGRGDLLLAGAVAARRRGLAPDLHASETKPKAFAALLQHAEANGIAPAPGAFQQAAIGTDPEKAPPRGSTVQEVLAGQDTWDWVRIAARSALIPLLRLSVPLLTERVRFLSLVTHSRREEAHAIRMLARGGWRLVAEQPVALRRRDPEAAERTGVQVWRGSLV